jgi:quinol monooxygenase YgiN
MYVSRLSFYTRPGHTEEVAQRLKQLADMIVATGLSRPRILRLSLASPGAPDLQFEQEVEHLADLEHSIEGVTQQEEFQRWSAEVSEFVSRPPKREILKIET